MSYLPATSEDHGKRQDNMAGGRKSLRSWENMASGWKTWQVAGIYKCSGNYGRLQEQSEVKRNMASDSEILQVAGKYRKRQGKVICSVTLGEVAVKYTL